MEIHGVEAPGTFEAMKEVPIQLCNIMSLTKYSYTKILVLKSTTFRGKCKRKISCFVTQDVEGFPKQDTKPRNHNTKHWYTAYLKNKTSMRWRHKQS